jgi:hypothetical protein
MRGDNMRNPERIGELLLTLKKIWDSCPDMRFNQLVDFLQSEYNDYKGQVYSKVLWEKDTNEQFAIVSYRKTVETDLFYVEDEDFLEFLQKVLDERKK